MWGEVALSVTIYAAEVDFQNNSLLSKVKIKGILF